jgi:glycolate dehydrogenase FAD-binding subunit
MARFVPCDINELRDAVGAALAAEEAVELVAGGSKRGFGRPLQTPHTLDLSRLCGIRDYEPSELVLTAAAATPLAEIERVLGEARQMLAFEPPDWDALYGIAPAEAGRRTLGGVIAGNLAGPRRPKAGAARDHFLGLRGVSGRAEIFKAGGRVVKNVTGYDLPKLLAGSWGTLAAIEEITVKVLPQPDHAATIRFAGLDPETALVRLGRALGSPHDISGAAFAPTAMPGLPEGLALRLEGPEPSVAFRRERLLAEFGEGCEAAIVAGEASAALWRAVRDAAPFAAAPERAVWRVSVPPSDGARFALAVARRLDAQWYLDWGGGLVWLGVAGAEDGGAAAIRTALAGNGHATLVRGAPGLRRAIPVFEPQPAPLAALTARVKDGFDPRHILNPGRMVEGL